MRHDCSVMMPRGMARDPIPVRTEGDDNRLQVDQNVKRVKERILLG